MQLVWVYRIPTVKLSSSIHLGSASCANCSIDAHKAVTWIFPNGHIQRQCPLILVTLAESVPTNSSVLRFIHHSPWCSPPINTQTPHIVTGAPSLHCATQPRVLISWVSHSMINQVIAILVHLTPPWTLTAKIKRNLRLDQFEPLVPYRFQCAHFPGPGMQ